MTLTVAEAEEGAELLAQALEEAQGRLAGS